MLRIECPHCGARDHSEFQYGGDATQPRPAFDDPSIDHWYAHVFERRNPCGVHNEYWQHVAGCRAWLVVTRDTGTHQILGVLDARERAARQPSVQQPVAHAVAQTAELAQ